MNTVETSDKSVGTRSLLKATLIAAVLASLLLITVILPAEFNVDPTGMGELIGLTALSIAADENTETKPGSIDAELTAHETVIHVPSGGGIEYKFLMKQHDKMTYEWSGDGESLHVDLHGEPAGDTTGFFESYVVATANRMNGSFTVPFDGSHGWYWRNDTEEDIMISLSVSGAFEVLGLK